MITERPDGTFKGVPRGCTVRRGTTVQTMYGGFHGGDPREFTPDPECSTDEERAAHSRACAEWNAGSEASPETARCVVTPGMIACSSGPFGLGTYQVRLDCLEIVHPDGRVTVAI